MLGGHFVRSTRLEVDTPLQGFDGLPACNFIAKIFEISISYWK